MVPQRGGAVSRKAYRCHTQSPNLYLIFSVENPFFFQQFSLTNLQLHSEKNLILVGKNFVTAIELFLISIPRATPE